MTQKPTALQVVDDAALAETDLWVREAVPDARTSTVELNLTSLDRVRRGRRDRRHPRADEQRRGDVHPVRPDRQRPQLGDRAYSVHSGGVATSLARHLTRDDFTDLTNIEPANPGQQKIDVRRHFTMPEHGAATQVWVAVSTQLAEVGSVYLADCGIRQDIAPYAVDTEHATALWDVSEKLCVPR